MEKELKHIYEAPALTFVTFKTERGFNASVIPVSGVKFGDKDGANNGNLEMGDAMGSYNDWSTGWDN